jgi:adenylate cyclase
VSDGAESAKTLALVFTDLAGSTALKTARGDQRVGELIAQHRLHVERFAADAGGRIIGWAGDGCFLTFEAPSAAVLFALRLERAHGEDTTLPAVRIGIHMGEVSERTNGQGHAQVEGLAVDLASRICGLARPGQVLLSAAVADSVRPRLGATATGQPIRWQTHGSYRLKGFDKPLEIAEAGVEGSAFLAAPKASEKATPTSSRTRFPLAALVLLTVLGLAALAATYLRIWSPRSDRAAARQPLTSLAVLPFKNFSGDPEQEYFVDGMTEALISELAKIKSIKVISRTSAMVYKGTAKPLPQVARELGVDGLIEGSVYKGDQEIRITAQLIRGATDEHLWAESYTETLANVLRLQAKVALAISREIQATLSPEDERRLASARAVVPEAHAAFLKGGHFFSQGTAQGFELASRHYHDALQRDPDYAPAYAGLAELAWVPSIMGFARSDFPVARALANEAVRLDPACADAHIALAWIGAVYEWDWTRAEGEFRRAIALDPSGSLAYHGLADLLANVGRMDEAIAAAETAVERDPLSGYALWELAYTRYAAGQYDAALRDFERLFQLAPDMNAALVDLATTYRLAGRTEDAVRTAREAVTHDGNASNRAFAAFILASAGRQEEAERLLREALAAGTDGYLTPAYAAKAQMALGHTDEAFRWLGQGLDERDYSVVLLKTHPDFAPLRGDPRFRQLLRRMHLPE